MHHNSHPGNPQSMWHRIRHKIGHWAHHNKGASGMHFMSWILQDAWNPLYHLNNILKFRKETKMLKEIDKMVHMYSHDPRLKEMQKKLETYFNTAKGISLLGQQEGDAAQELVNRHRRIKDPNVKEAARDKEDALKRWGINKRLSEEEAASFYNLVSKRRQLIAEVNVYLSSKTAGREYPKERLNALMEEVDAFYRLVSSKGMQDIIIRGTKEYVAIYNEGKTAEARADLYVGGKNLPKAEGAKTGTGRTEEMKKEGAVDLELRKAT